MQSVQSMLDFSVLRNYVTKGRISVQVVKCPECKAPLGLPESGSFVKRAFGTNVYPSYIMDRVEQLLG